MKHVKLSEVLPADGIETIRVFRKELADGEHGRDYLDVHAALRERLRPFEAYLAEHGMTDIDYFTLVVLRALGVNKG
jgi:hypothetical protein